MIGTDTHMITTNQAFSTRPGLGAFPGDELTSKHTHKNM